MTYIKDFMNIVLNSMHFYLIIDSVLKSFVSGERLDLIPACILMAILISIKFKFFDTDKKEAK